MLHRRCVQSDDRRLARRLPYANADGARRDRDGPLEPGAASSRASLSLRRRVAVHRIRYGERLQEIGAVPSIGTVGDSFDNALAETVNGYYKAELIRGPARTGPWKTIEEVELATLGWVHWHNTQRLHGYLGDVPPAEFEQHHAAQLALKTPDPRDLPVAEGAHGPADRLPARQPQPVDHPDRVRLLPHAARGPAAAPSAGRSPAPTTLDGTRDD